MRGKVAVIVLLLLTMIASVVGLFVPGTTGPVGPVGKQGKQGIQGMQGIQGEDGKQGVSGEAGQDALPDILVSKFDAQLRTNLTFIARGQEFYILGSGFSFVPMLFIRQSNLQDMFIGDYPVLSGEGFTLGVVMRRDVIEGNAVIIACFGSVSLIVASTPIVIY